MKESNLLTIILVLVIIFLLVCIFSGMNKTSHYSAQDAKKKFKNWLNPIKCDPSIDPTCGQPTIRYNPRI